MWQRASQAEKMAAREEAHTVLGALLLLQPLLVFLLELLELGLQVCHSASHFFFTGLQHENSNVATTLKSTQRGRGAQQSHICETHNLSLLRPAFQTQSKSGSALLTLLGMPWPPYTPSVHINQGHRLLPPLTVVLSGLIVHRS